MEAVRAMIISPDAIGCEFQCHGYTSVTNFDSVGCNLTLHHGVIMHFEVLDFYC
jgi:hypothetical protein